VLLGVLPHVQGRLTHSRLTKWEKTTPRRCPQVGHPAAMSTDRRRGATHGCRVLHDACQQIGDACPFPSGPLLPELSRRSHVTHRGDAVNEEVHDTRPRR
jgi:hypothetical protein